MLRPHGSLHQEMSSKSAYVDGAVFAQHRAVGNGVIFRDDMGRVEAALSKRLDAPLGAVEAEAMAYETGLLFAKDIGVQEVVIEGDSLINYSSCIE